MGGVKRIKRLSVALTIAVLLLAGVGSGQAQAETPFEWLPSGPFVFPDTASHWSRSEVEAAAGLGLFSGYGDGRFRPDQAITRAEFIKIVVAGFGVEDPGSDALAFADQTAIADSVFEPFVRAAAAHGLISPDDFAGRRLDMNRPITRAEMARILSRALNDEPVPADAPQPSLSDIPDGDLGDYVRDTVRRGVVTGYPDGTFGPDRTATRAEAAAMLLRAMRARAGLGPHAVAGSAAEVAFPVHQFVLAGVYGFADEADGGAAVMSQWATPEAIAAFQEILTQLADGATRFATPYTSDQPTWVGRDASVAGVDLDLTRFRNGKWEGRRVGFNFYLRFQDNRWLLTGLGVVPNYGDVAWVEMRTGKPPHSLLFRISDSLLGNVHTVSIPDPKFDAEVVRHHFETFGGSSRIKLLTVDGVPWEQADSAITIEPNLITPSKQPEGQLTMHIFDASINRLTLRQMSQSEIGGLLWNSFYYHGHSLPLAINDVPWSRIWREEIVIELSAMPRDQVTLRLEELGEELYKLLMEGR